MKKQRATSSMNLLNNFFACFFDLNVCLTSMLAHLCSMARFAFGYAALYLRKAKPALSL